MPVMSIVRRAAVGVTVCATLAVTTAACGSDSDSGSGGAPSQAQIVAKLRNEPQLNKLLDGLGQASGSADAKTKIDQLKSKIYPCFAKGLQQSASAATLRQYVDGNRPVQTILDSSGQKKFEAASKNCLSDVLPKS